MTYTTQQRVRKHSRNTIWKPINTNVRGVKIFNMENTFVIPSTTDPPQLSSSPLATTTTKTTTEQALLPTSYGFRRKFVYENLETTLVCQPIVRYVDKKQKPFTLERWQEKKNWQKTIKSTVYDNNIQCHIQNE